MIWIFIIWLVGFLICAGCLAFLAFTREEDYYLSDLFEDIIWSVGSWVTIALTITDFFVGEVVLYKYHNDEEL